MRGTRAQKLLSSERAPNFICCPCSCVTHRTDDWWLPDGPPFATTTTMTIAIIMTNRRAGRALVLNSSRIWQPFAASGGGGDRARCDFVAAPERRCTRTQSDRLVLSWKIWPQQRPFEKRFSSPGARCKIFSTFTRSVLRYTQPTVASLSRSRSSKQHNTGFNGLSSAGLNYKF